MIGTTLNQYRITASIGAGGMGEVFRARDTRLQRDVALKVLPKAFITDADRLRRFEQEAKTLAALNHPNVLTVFDAGVREGAPYLVCELLEGQTLRGVLGANAALPVRKATDYALQIARGLAAAHENGVIHRDLKPENIFVTKDERVKILDFGLAKLRADLKSEIRNSESLAEADAPTLVESTVPGLVLGTPAYMSPEQVRGELADHRTDIFSFGCVLYEMLSGVRLFRRDTPVESMNAVLKEDAPDLVETHPNLPPALERVVLHCLEKQAERRFQSAGDLGFALETLSGFTGMRSQRERESGNLLRLLLIGALLFVAIVIAVIARFHLGSKEASAPVWRGERLGGPVIAFTARPSPDAKELAFCAMEDGLSQVAMMVLDSGDSKILTTNRSRGLVSSVGWSLDGSKIFYDRVAGGPNGIYRVSKLGGEERLVLESASDPRVLADGSILLIRRSTDGNNQLSIYSPETERVRELNGFPEGGPISTFELLSNRNEAVFWGRTTNDPAGAPRLWRIDLKNGMISQFVTNVIQTSLSGPPIPFAGTSDGRRFLFTQQAENLWLISAVDLLASRKARPLLALMDRPTSLDIDSAGRLYLDQAERPNEILRCKPGSTVERFLIPPADGPRTVLPLSNNRFLIPVSKHNSGRLMVMEPGKELRPFIESKLDSGAPFARLGKEQIVFTVRNGSRYELATASLEGRNIKKVEGVSWSDNVELAVTGMTDGKTIYFAQGGFVYSLPASGGTPTKICVGHSLAMDPHGQFLVVVARGVGENHLIRYSFANGAEDRITTSGQYPITGAPYSLGPGAVAPDGRIVVVVAPLDSWFWSTAIVDPGTGEMTFATDLQADMYGSGWDDEGRVVTSARLYRSSLWRFSPEK